MRGVQNGVLVAFDAAGPATSGAILPPPNVRLRRVATLRNASSFRPIPRRQRPPSIVAYGESEAEPVPSLRPAGLRRPSGGSRRRPWPLPAMRSAPAVAATAVLAKAGVTFAGTVTAAAWGATVEGGVPSPKPRFVNTQLVTRFACRSQYGDAAIRDGMICAAAAGGGKGICKGDGGGPLYKNGTLLGIASHSNGCGRAGSSDILTSVASSRTCIDSKGVQEQAGSDQAMRRPAAHRAERSSNRAPRACRPPGRRLLMHRSLEWKVFLRRVRRRPAGVGRWCSRR